MAGTSDLRFKARELKPYAEPVTAAQLGEGSVYFTVQYADDDMRIPIVGTWVYAGQKLDPKDTEGRYYFQDVESYRRGIRYDSDDGDATFTPQLERYLNHIFEYEDALNELLRCSLRRQLSSR